jgi:hypothetical protein
MKAGFRGTFVISWSQTEIDGFEAAPVGTLAIGCAWSWRGDTVRVDGPSDVLRLDRATESQSLRRRAAVMVHRLVGAALAPEGAALPRPEAAEMPIGDNSFVVTDGAQSYTVTLIEVGGGSRPLLMFLDEIPPRDTELWVVHHTLDAALGHPDGRPKTGGTICFTPGTMLRTPTGTKRIEDLVVGDMVQTKDNGPQPVVWIGSRRMTGARLFVMPHLRPVRFRVGAMGVDRPEAELLVSPDHRLLLSGPDAQALFNTPEVLVTARDLVNGRSVIVDLAVRDVTYIHLLLPGHNVLWANGLETESFHPASADVSMLDQADREQLLQYLPEVADDPHVYGGYARRNLSTSDAAILGHVA